MQTVQLAIADAVYRAALREALVHSGPWLVVPVEVPDPGQKCVLVLDEDSFNRLRLPLAGPERVVLISKKDPTHLSRAWDAGIVSVVTADDPPATVLLAIMAAALRIPKGQIAAVVTSGISPTRPIPPAPISPDSSHSDPKRVKSH